MKNLFKKNRCLYLITDRTISGLTHIQMTHQAISAGVKTIQLREKEMSKRDIYKSAVFIKKLTLKKKVTFIINDYIDIAMAVNADGVHLGQEDMPIEEARKIIGKKKIIGISTHNLNQAVKAQESGADYIGFGPVFHTATKAAGRQKGLKALVEVKKHIKVPVVAIGGVTLENVMKVLNAGADAVAVASGILSGNIKTNTGKFFDSIQQLQNYILK